MPRRVVKLAAAERIYSTRPNNSKTFSGIFCSNKRDQPIALLDFAHLLPLKVKQNFHVLELFDLIQSKYRIFLADCDDSTSLLDSHLTSPTRDGAPAPRH
jgi:hypothetical protein